MQYNFDNQPARWGTNAYKWDSAGSPDIIPLWVADMDFQTAPCVIEALRQRVEHGIFGYTLVPDSYYESIIRWFEVRHDWHIEREWIQYTTGVVPALSAVLKALCKRGDKVITQTPAYNCFFSSIRNNGLALVSNPLVYRDSYYTIDFDLLEQQAADPQAKVLLLCNPHNPSGRVWRKEELAQVAAICARHDLWLISDEIHCELTPAGIPYTPMGTIEGIADRLIVCNSPSKAFNIAGLQIANIICANAEVRAKIDRAINDNEVCDVNPFGVIALQAAYNEGAEWLDQLNEYIAGNYRFLCDFMHTHLPQIGVTRLEGTYLVWLDCHALNTPSVQLEEELKENARVWLNAGTMYGAEGEGFMRVNLACPRHILQEGLQRVYDYCRR